MTTQSFEEAVQTLKRRLTGRWEGGESAGRDEMVNTLRNELGYTAREAHDAIDAMIDANILRYYHPGLVEGEVGVVPPLVAPMGVQGSTGATSPTGLAAPLAAAPGYWQIGPNESDGEGDSPVREGQVRPSE